MTHLQYTLLNATLAIPVINLAIVFGFLYYRHIRQENILRKEAKETHATNIR